MSFFVVLLGLLLVVTVGSLFTWRWAKAERVERSRDQARLKVIEGQLAALRAALRISVAEHMARRIMQGEMFANPTDHEEYRPS